MQLGPWLAVNGRQHDAVDEAAQDISGFGQGFGVVEGLGEAFDLVTIKLGKVGMKPQHWCSLAGAKACFRAILDGAHDGGELALDLGESSVRFAATVSCSTELASLHISALKASTKAAIRSGAIIRSLSPLRTRSSSVWRLISSAFVQVLFDRCAAHP
jgi:hypothetical protein